MADKGIHEQAGRFRMAAAWQHLGDHARALGQLARVDESRLPPVERAEYAALAAVSLEALGRHAEAEQKRSQARSLAPLAAWNRSDDSPEAGVWEECQDQPDRLLEPVPETPVTDSAAGDRPSPRAISRLGPAAWILALPAMIPLVGVLAALPLLLIGMILVARRRRWPHDRTVGAAALGLSMFSLACTAAVVAVRLPMLVPGLGPRMPAAAMSLPADEAWADEKAETAEEENDLEADADSRPSRPGSDPVHADDEDPGNEPSPPDPMEPAAANESSNLAARFLAPRPVWRTLATIAALIVSIIFHEIAHALAAYWSGDTTARDQKRISLNPLRHINWVGSVLVPGLLSLAPGGVIIGWAKPVPLRPQRFRRFRRGLLGTSLAGVSVNLLLALLALNLLIVLQLFLGRLHPEAAWFREPMEAMVPLTLEGIPVAWAWTAGIEISKTLLIVNMMLFFLNILPLPPLDGFRATCALLPARVAGALDRLAHLGTLVLIILIATPAIKVVVVPAAVVLVFLLAMAALVSGWL